MSLIGWSLKTIIFETQQQGPHYYNVYSIVMETYWNGVKSSGAKQVLVEKGW